MLNLSAPLLNLITKNHKYSHLLTIDFSPTLALTDAGRSISHNGETFLPEFWRGAPESKMTGSPKTNDLSLEFTGVDQTIIAILLSGEWINRPVTIEKAFFDDSGGIVGTQTVFSGFTTEYEINEDKESEVIITASSIWADFEKESGRKTNSKSHQRFAPNDQCFDLTPEIPDEVPWGRSGPGAGPQW